MRVLWRPSLLLLRATLPPTRRTQVTWSLYAGATRRSWSRKLLDCGDTAQQQLQRRAYSAENDGDVQEGDETHEVGYYASLITLPVVALLDSHVRRIEDIEREVQKLKIGSAFEVRLRKEASRISDLVSNYESYCGKQKEIGELRGMVAELEREQGTEGLAVDARAELTTCEGQLDELAASIIEELLPPADDDEKDIVLEVRAGTGGAEASLFALELFNMYREYAVSRGWKFDMLQMQMSEQGGAREVAAAIEGSSVYSWLKYESGVHRVQRVPATEVLGRVHTSTVTVAILPTAEDLDIKIEERDLLIETYRSSGAGGQHVNKTDSAVRITHVPTGTVVAIQDERSQHKNKARAMLILRSKVYEKERARLHASRIADRAQQIGKGERNERIRTYNYHQDRVTDHRISYSASNIEAFMNGLRLDSIITRLRKQEKVEALCSLEHKS